MHAFRKVMPHQKAVSVLIIEVWLIKESQKDYENLLFRDTCHAPLSFLCVVTCFIYAKVFFSLFCMKKKGKAVDLRLQSHLYFLSSLGEAFNQKHACHAYISTLFCLTQRNEQTIDKRCQRERYGSNLVLLRILT